ncbi:hypothetical protein ACQPU1_03470 [Clostridium paraputrificum]|uniref:hypothetical protein n=1 Tax=Clostridium TaxID=1485 RepID=UPI003D3340D1
MKKKLKYDVAITYFFYILLAATLIWDLTSRGGEKAWRIGLIYLTTFVTRLLFTKTFLRRSKAAYVVTLAFIFISMYLANVLNFYGIPYYDKFLHLTSGILLAFFGLIIYIYLSGNKENKSMRKITIVIFPFIFAIASAGIWEVWEFATDQIFGLTAQMNDLHDTMWDIICGTIGGGFSCIFMYLHCKGNNIKFIRAIIDEMEDKE